MLSIRTPGSLVLALPFAILIAGLASWSPVRAASESAAETQSPNTLLCTARATVRYRSQCAPFGPTAITEPGSVPLPTTSSDPYLGFVANDYLRVTNGPVEVYSGVDPNSGVDGSATSISDGFVYLSAYESIETGHGTVYRTQSGFVSGGSVARVEPSYLKGLSFYRTPQRAFGWIVSGGSCPQRTPGGVEDYATRCYTRYTVFQVLDKRVVDNVTWYEIAPDEWLDQRLVSVVEPSTARPEGVEGDRWIEVNLHQQTITAYEDGELTFATVASTGRYGAWTQPGSFQVWAKLERDNMTGGLEGSFYYLEDVPWVLYFDQARALHGTYWHDRFGTPTSRGCVNLSPADAEWVYQFAEEGTWVHVWDPSGETPTDPALYGAGGA